MTEHVEKAVTELIEPVAWKRCELINRAEREFAKDDHRKARCIVGMPDQS
jgi:hypothetical protein